MIISPAHFVRARYLGPTDRKPARFVVSWEGWPTDDSRPVRRVLPWMEGDKLAAEAARLFCAWLSAGFADDPAPVTFSPAAVTYASTGPDGWAILIRTRDSREA